MHICPCHQFTQTQKRAEKSAQKELEVESRVCLHLDYLFEKRQKRQKEAPARFELTISCLLDRRFNQLSHGAVVNIFEKIGFELIRYVNSNIHIVTSGRL